MTEAEWLACADPEVMLESLRYSVSDRQLRLFAVACARRVWDSLPGECGRQTPEVVKCFADDAASGAELWQAHDRAEAVVEALLADPSEQRAYDRQLYAADAVLIQAYDGVPPGDWVHGVAACGVQVATAAGGGEAKR
jgi:hypothetical protein